MAQPQNSNGSWKQYAMGVLLLLTTSLAGIAYSNVTDRIAKLETSQDKLDQLLIDVALLKQSSNSQMMALGSLDSKVDAVLEQSQENGKQLNTTAQTYRRNTKVWNEHLQQWEDAVAASGRKR